MKKMAVCALAVVMVTCWCVLWAYSPATYFVTWFITMAAVLGLLAKWFFQKRSSHQELGGLLKEKQAKLSKAQASLVESEKYIRSLKQSISLAETVIGEIKSQIKLLLSENREHQAELLTDDLLLKEQSLKRQKTELLNVMVQYTTSQKTIEQYRLEILGLEQTAEGLQVRQALAESEKDATDSMSPISSAIAAQVDEIITTQSEVEANKLCSGKHQIGVVERRLAEIKAELNNA